MLVESRAQRPVSPPQIRPWRRQLKSRYKKMSKFLGPVEFSLISLLYPINFFRDCTFKSFNWAFILKTPISCNSLDVICAAICSGCLEEYIGETGVGKPRLRDRVNSTSN